MSRSPGVRARFGRPLRPRLDEQPLKPALSGGCQATLAAGRSPKTVEIRPNDGDPERVHVIGCFSRQVRALVAADKVILQGVQLGAGHHSEVVALQIVIGNVFHSSVVGRLNNSLLFFANSP